MKNKLHLNGSLGLILIGVGILMVFLVSLIVWSRISWRMREFSIMLDLETYKSEDLFFLCLGVGHLLAGGGLLGRAKWSQYFSSFVIGVSFIGWTYIVLEVFEINDYKDRFEFWFSLGLTLPVYILLFCTLLFLGNEKVNKDRTDEDEDFWDNEILDA